MVNKPFFSIIIPTYNRRDFIVKAIKSVLNQIYTHFELIIIDDGSTDDTKEIVQSFNDNRIIYKFHKNHGVSFARNKGLEMVRGDFVAFLDSDDWWTIEKLQKTSTYIQDFPKIKIFHTEEIWHRNGELLKQLKKHKKPTGWVYKKALSLCCISISTVAINREVFETVGMFDESFEACEDYDFWLRATNKYKVKLIPECLTEKDGGRLDQLSSSVWGLDRFRIKALEKMLSSYVLNKENYFETLNVLEKKCKIFAKGALKYGNKENAEYYKTLPLKYGK